MVCRLQPRRQVTPSSSAWWWGSWRGGLSPVMLASALLHRATAIARAHCGSGEHAAHGAIAGRDEAQRARTARVDQAASSPLRFRKLKLTRLPPRPTMATPPSAASCPLRTCGSKPGVNEEVPWHHGRSDRPFHRAPTPIDVPFGGASRVAWQRLLTRQMSKNRWSRSTALPNRARTRRGTAGAAHAAAPDHRGTPLPSRSRLSSRHQAHEYGQRERLRCELRRVPSPTRGGSLERPARA